MPVVLAALAAGLPACAGGDPAAPAQVWQGDRRDFAEAGARVVTSTREWRALWQQIGRDPPVAWPEDAVAAAFLAQRQPTAGHAIVVSAEPRDDRLCLAWDVAAPEGAAAQVLTRPWRVQLYRPGPDGPPAVALADSPACAADRDR